MENENKCLDELNNERVHTTRKRVAHAIKLAINPIDCLADGRKLAAAQTDIAHAVNLLEAGNQEMKWACEHFDWNYDVCDQIDDACAKLGSCLSLIEDEDDEEYDPTYAACEGKEALAMLGKALATLIRWFDDDQDVSEL